MIEKFYRWEMINIICKLIKEPERLLYKNRNGIELSKTQNKAK